jgi:hypothetical protein
MSEKRFCGTVLCALVASAAAGGQPHLNQSDYEQIATIILQHEGGEHARPWTIFVGLVDIEAMGLVPALQRLYRPPVVVKGSGEDWGTRQDDGCHFDKATGTPATGIFVSAAEWRGSGDVAFQVTFAACAIGTHLNRYVFDRSGSKWTLKAVEPGATS